ncbi:MAG: hypothetical protein ACOH1H_08780 [Brevundimonas sp.]
MAKAGKRDKQTKFGATPQPVKKAKVSDPTIEGQPLAWRFSGCDGDGPFSWAALVPGDKHRAVLQRLAAFEAMTWEQIIATKSHQIPLASLGREAKERLKAIERDDEDELMSFRIAGAERVWCFKDGSLMRVLWWDPEHKVYPLEKDRADRKKVRNR